MAPLGGALFHSGMLGSVKTLEWETGHGQVEWLIGIFYINWSICFCKLLLTAVNEFEHHGR